VRIRNEQDAIAAFVALLGSIPEGNHVSATRLELASLGGDTDECLWRVGLALDDENDIDSMAPMGITILGPDGKEWWMSGSWLYDPEIAEKALAHLYIEGVADLVDPEMLADHVRLITEQRNHAIEALPDAARRGELRRAPRER
jgi:hypothetical protein